MSIFKLPLTPAPQTFNVLLGTVTYTVTMVWNTFANVWVLDFVDQDGNKILSGVPMITGADLLEQYAYLGFQGALYAQNDTTPSTPPNFTDLGTGSNLYYASA